MNDAFDLPDMEDLARQIEDAMADAQKAMEDLPAQMGEMDDVMGSLSALMGGLPAQMEELSGALAGFGAQHQANSAALAGEPDWSLEANIRVGDALHVVVSAAFDLAQASAAWSSTQGAEFESVVGETVAGVGGEMDSGLMGQIMDQLKKGRGIALVKDVEVLACRIQGAPADAAQTLQLSPEGNIPLTVDAGGVGFEFAPLLTIRNRWERADIPTFSPMGDEVVVPFDRFEAREAFGLTFKPQEQADPIVITLDFRPLI
ncbi:MAG: hypothetical protein P8129_07235 [Anaerolineae bacterium]